MANPHILFRFARGLGLGGAIAALVSGFPAAAQDTPLIDAGVPRVQAENTVFDGDFAIVGVGALSIPSYTGSDSGRIIPAAGAVGEVAGIGFVIGGPSLSLDLLAGRAGPGPSLAFGPQIRLRSNRNGSIGDPVVARLGKLDNVIEGGFHVGLGFNEVLSQADSLLLGASARWDISGKGGGMVVTPSISYMLPVSRAQVVGVLASAQYVDGDFADYNYAISPAGAAASGLPAFDAKGGFHQATIGIATARDLSGDFLDGGFSMGVGVMYSRLFGSAARTPITSIRGSRDQWVFGGGLAYMF